MHCVPIFHNRSNENCIAVWFSMQILCTQWKHMVAFVLESARLWFCAQFQSKVNFATTRSHLKHTFMDGLNGNLFDSIWKSGWDFCVCAYAPCIVRERASVYACLLCYRTSRKVLGNFFPYKKKKKRNWGKKQQHTYCTLRRNKSYYRKSLSDA